MAAWDRLGGRGRVTWRLAIGGGDVAGWVGRLGLGVKRGLGWTDFILGVVDWVESARSTAPLK